MVHFRVILAIGRNGTTCPNLVETKICQVENICPDIGPTATPMPYLPDVIQLYGLYPGKMWQVFFYLLDMSFEKFLLAVESCDLSQADKSIIYTVWSYNEWRHHCRP